MGTRNWELEQFEVHRAHLLDVAYRMLGSMSESEDAVQEAWVRLDRTDGDAIDNIGGWLTTVVARVCLDMLRSRRARREDLMGATLPEPVVTIEPDGNPEQQALLADSVGLALLVVLDALTPAERLAFVLHDMFDVPFEEIAPMVERTPAAARKLASRARQRVRGMAPSPDRDLARQRQVVDAFLAASRAGDFDALMRVLDPDVTFRFDTGARLPARPTVTGAPAVARQVLARGSRFAPDATPAIVNGTAGVIIPADDGLRAVAAFTVARGRVAAIDLILDQEKLSRVAESVL
jgi:RNA polymerase sigma factor (sigma-70 family)